MKLDIYQDKARAWRWRFVGRNGRIVAASGESFTRRATAARSAQRLVAAMIDACADGSWPPAPPAD